MEDLTQFRRELHQYPEVSGNEKETAKRVVSFLKQYAPTELLTQVGGAGILAVYEGKEKGKTILLRCELDALPIQEINTFEYRSLYEGVSHKCGHDGHTTILCSVAKVLHEKPIANGKVILMFQPAEENGVGAKAVFEDLAFRNLQPDYVFALHNLPGFPLHDIVVKNNTFTCAVNSIIIELHGKTSHAGEPEKGFNPAQAIGEIISAFLQKAQPDIRQNNYCLLTPVYLQMGEKSYGISAGYGEVHFTVRSDKNNAMVAIEQELETLATTIAKKYDLIPKLRWTESFKANENHPQAVDCIRRAALRSNLNLKEKNEPFTFGEDFGLFTQHFKGAMFGLGAGLDVPALHNPDYDFPDELIASGSVIFLNLIKEVLDA